LGKGVRCWTLQPSYAGSLCFAPYDEGKQQEEQVRWSDSIIWSPAPQQDFSGFVNMHDPADSSEMLGSVYHLMREGVQHTQPSLQFRQSPAVLLYGIAAVDKRQPSLSHQGIDALNQLFHLPLQLQYQVGLEVHVLNHTTIPGELDTIYPRGETRDSTAVGYTRHTTLAEFNIITPGEDCALPVELAGQLGKHQPHYIAAADKEHSSSSHKGRYTSTQPLCTESHFGQGGICFMEFSYAALLIGNSTEGCVLLCIRQKAFQGKHNDPREQ